MTDLTTTRTPEVIAAEIRALTSTALSTIIEIGRRFAEAKAMIPHGEWGNWLKESTGYSQRTAQNFMRLYDAYGDEQGSLFGASAKTQAFASLPYTKALALLSVPEEDREAFAEEVDAESISLRELQEKIREREQDAETARMALESAKAAQRETEAALRDARADLEAAQDTIHELQQRPVDVAVRDPSPEELDALVADRLRESDEQHAKVLAGADEARRKIELDLAKANMEVKSLKDKIKNLKADQEKAVEAAKGEGKQEAAEKIKELRADLMASQNDAQELINQMADLKKRVAMADEATISYKAAFSQWQRAHADMMEALKRADPETAAKLKAARAAQIDAWDRSM